MGLYAAGNIELIVIKDPDMITTTDIVRRNIINPATKAQMIIFTTTRPNSKCLDGIRIDQEIKLNRFAEISPNVRHLCIECASFAAKVSALKKILMANDGQSIVFSQVIL